MSCVLYETFWNFVSTALRRDCRNLLIRYSFEYEDIKIHIPWKIQELKVLITFLSKMRWESWLLISCTTAHPSKTHMWKICHQIGSVLRNFSFPNLSYYNLSKRVIQYTLHMYMYIHVNVFYDMRLNTYVISWNDHLVTSKFRFLKTSWKNVGRKRDYEAF